MQLSIEDETRLKALVDAGRFTSIEAARAAMLADLEFLTEQWFENQSVEEYAHETDPAFLRSLDEGLEAVRRGEGKTYASADAAMADIWPKGAQR